MKNINETIKRLLFISDQICEIYETMFKLSMTDQEESKLYNSNIEFFENYISQETTLLDNLSEADLITIMKNLYDGSFQDAAINRCYETIKYYFLDKYPTNKSVVDEIEGILEESDYQTEESIDDIDEEIDEEIGEADDEKQGWLKMEYEDESNVSEYANYVTLRTEINVIKNLYQHIKNTEADNKIDAKYKKELLKQFKGFKCDFFFQNRDTEKLGIACHFDINKLPNLPELMEDFTSIYYNECLDILDDLYLMPSEERDAYTILETLFDMLCFDEYIKELTHEQIDRLIETCHRIEATLSKSYFGNVGLQKLVRIKKN